eukprot:s5455_g2.t1
MPKLWEVLGGADKGGIVVRQGRELTSAALPVRLATGSVLEELAASENRLHFRRLAGTGPDEGWVSIAVAGKRLVARAEDAFSGAWEDDEGTEVVIDGLTMHGLGTSLPLEVSGVRMCSFRMSGEVFQGRLLGDGRLLWSDGALWCRKAVPGGLVRSDDAPSSAVSVPSHRGEAKAKPNVAADAPLRPRGPDGRRPLPERSLSAKEIVDWIAEAIDVFETMLLPLEAIVESKARLQYKQLLLLVHPDKNSQEGSTDAFRKLFDAFAVIVDPAAQRRALLRAEGRKGGSSAGASKGGANSWSFPGFGFFDENGGIGGVVAAVFMQDNVDESERVLLEQSDLLEALGKYDGSDKTWVDPEKAKALWDADAAIFVDVRDGDEYYVSHVEKALNINWGIASWVKGTEEFKQLEKDPSKMVIVYSDNGSQLSRCGQVASTLSYFLREHRVRRLRRGLNAWKRHGYPVEGSRQTFFARQRLGDNVLKLGDSGFELEEGQKPQFTSFPSQGEVREPLQKSLEASRLELGAMRGPRQPCRARHGVGGVDVGPRTGNLRPEESFDAMSSLSIRRGDGQHRTTLMELPSWCKAEDSEPLAPMRRNHQTLTG